MHHIEHITVTVKGLPGKPKTYILPRYIGEELQAYMEAQADQERIPAENIFPDTFDTAKGPAIALRGLRYRENLTQKELAKKIGIHQHHLSEMENGKRSIGKDMARKLAKALHADWKIFL